ncbi:MAG: PstA family ABC transporter permease [Planctomycetota bacterium]|nr:PstA family ABC transporter permease [Planctomycetota bacterium]
MHSLRAQAQSNTRRRSPGEIVAAAAPASQLARRVVDRGFLALCIVFTGLAVVILGILLVTIWQDGHTRLSWQFLNSFASRRTEEAGVRAPMWGSIWACVICALAAVPIGVGTAIYLEEFSKRSRFRSFIQLNIANLAGVPSIVYGILGLTAFARAFGSASTDSPITIGQPESFFYLQLPFGHGVLAGGLTLMLVVLPIIIVSSQEALRSVPRSLRTASLALGGTQWQTTWNITLPASIPMIMTGAILAMSRAIGEAAPILVLGVPLFIRTTPINLMSDFTVLPLQIYNWSMRQQSGFHELAAAAIIVLLAVLLTLNAVAVIIRHRLQRAAS